MPDRLAFLRRVPIPWLLLPVLAILWLVPRFLGAPAPPNAAVDAAVDAVHAGPSPETGRLEVRGLPTPDDDPGGLLSRPEILAARARLAAAVRGRNDALSLRAADIARRLEPTDDDLVGLRLNGWLIPFYGPQADELRRLDRHAVDRPWEALRALTVALEARLEEPPQEGEDLDISGQRRDLTRLYREIDDALIAAETEVSGAVTAFRADARAAASDAAGPFRRSGRGLLAEILLASLLGATLREAIRRGGSAPGVIVRLSTAPVLAVGALLPLRGTTFLPVDPLRGVSLAFLPMAFALGYATGGLLTILSRTDRLFRDGRDDRNPGDEPAAAPRGDGAATAAGAGDAGTGNGAATGTAEAPGAAPASAEETPPTAEKLRPLRERVRELAQEVMAATGEPLRSERELPDEGPPPAAPPPRSASPRPAARAQDPTPAATQRRDPERLPFARRRPR